MSYPDVTQQGYEPPGSPEFLEKVTDPVIRQWLFERIAAAAKQRLELYMHRNWIEHDSDGFTGWRWVKYNKPLSIAAAACRYKDFILVGSRHYCVSMTEISQFISSDLLHEYADGDYEQGFIDFYGTFYSREEAWVIAEAAGQIRYPLGHSVGTLYSENLG